MKKMSKEEKSTFKFDSSAAVHGAEVKPTKEFITVGTVNILEKLHKIEEEKCVYNIHYCKAGIGFCFYEEDRDMGNWREALVTRGYYDSFEEAVEAEYDKLGFCEICGDKKALIDVHDNELVCRSCHLLKASGGRWGVK